MKSGYKAARRMKNILVMKISSYILLMEVSFQIMTAALIPAQEQFKMESIKLQLKYSLF
jgi:hypothetical protein